MWWNLNGGGVSADRQACQKTDMEVTGRATAVMFKQYADLFSEDDGRARQRKAQERLQLWQDANVTNPLSKMVNTNGLTKMFFHCRWTSW
jgi:hypothetical protein